MNGKRQPKTPQSEEKKSSKPAGQDDKSSTPGSGHKDEQEKKDHDKPTKG